MKRLLALSLLAVSLSAPARAGDIPFPGKQDPPPCTENCTAPTIEIPIIVIDLALMLITLR